MTAAPKGEKKADAENTDAVANAELAGTTPGAREEAEPLPTPIGPNDPVPEGKVETTVLAKDDELSDPAGRVTKQKKATRTVTRTVTRKSDPFKKEIDHDKLPVSVAIGQVTGTVESYAGRAVLSLSLRGWVGEAPFKILAEDVGEIEAVLAELRSQLG